jgi:tetratricopeptide (TPR) repeat protein
MIRRLLALSLLVACPAWAAGEQAEPARILIVPFENVTREGRLLWFTEASAILLTDALTARGQNVITRDERLRAFERLQLPGVASLSEATIIRVGSLVGASHIVLGGFTIEGAEIVVTARALRLDSGRMSSDVTERGRLDAVFGVYEAVARQLFPGAPEAAGRGSDGPREPLAVFENYVKGLLAESPARQERFLRAALKQAPRYEPARIALWQVYTAEGDHARAAASALAVAADAPLGRRARFLAALSRIRLKQYDEAFQALKALADDSSAPALSNNLGVIQLRRGSTPQTGKATYYFNQAAEAEHDDADYAFNLGLAYWFEREVQASVYWLKEAVRRNAADGDAHFVLGAALQAAGAQVEAEREKELARQLSSKYGEWERRPGASAEPVPKGLERLREELDTPHLSLVDSTLGPGEKRDQEELAKFHLDRARRLFEQQQDREAAAEVNRSLYVAPYQAEAHLLLGRIHLRAGRLKEAVEALKISLWSQETAAAHAVLADVYLQSKDPVLAASEVDKALALDPQSAEAKAIKGRIK